MTAQPITQTQESLVVEQSQISPLRSLFGSRNFRLLWIGQAISLLGDQLYFIALPWLVLQLTGDPLAMGLVLATGGVPRALLMLVGGAVTDRVTPRRVMIWSSIAQMVLVTVLGGVVLTDSITMWMIFLFAFAFGSVDAFFFPAQGSIVPVLVSRSQLGTANTVTMITEQLSLFVGPVLAGLVIAWAGTEAADGNLTGVGVAFMLDALTFLVAAVSLSFIRLPKAQHATEDTEGIWASTRAGLGYVWDNRSLRSLFLLIVFANVLIVAPMAVGIPVLADLRLSDGAASFGIILSAFGGGNLLGMALGGMLPRPATRWLGMVLICVWSVMGIGTAMLGPTDTTLMASLIASVMGMSNGYVLIVFITWLQTITPPTMLGRMMSLFGFSTIGLAPIANALMGGVIGWSLTGAFVGAGLLMTVTVLGAMALNPALRVLDVPTVERS